MGAASGLKAECGFQPIFQDGLTYLHTSTGWYLILKSWNPWLVYLAALIHASQYNGDTESYNRKPPLVLCFLNTNLFKWFVFLCCSFLALATTPSWLPSFSVILCAFLLFLILFLLSYLLSHEHPSSQTTEVMEIKYISLYPPDQLPKFSSCLCWTRLEPMGHLVQMRLIWKQSPLHKQEKSLLT